MNRQTRHWLRRTTAVLASLAILATSLAAVHPEKAGAGMTPPFLEATLRPGESITEHKVVSLEPVIPKADVVFSLDLTGSMGGVLNTAKAEAINVMNQLDALIADAHYGVVSHMDYPGTYNSYGYHNVYGDASCGDYAYRLDQGLTADRTAVSNAINGLRLACGSDGPESYERVLYESYSDPSIGWRSGARRMLIMFGDNIPHDNDINEGVPGKSGTFSTGGDPGRDAVMFTADDIDLQSTLAGMADHGLILFAVWTNPSTLSWWSHWASLTGGEGVLLGSTADLPATIENLIRRSATHLDNLHLEASAGFESWVSFSPAEYTDLTFRTPIEKEFDVTITVPMGTPPGTYSFQISAIGDGANYGEQTVVIHVRPLDEEPPVTVHSFSGLLGNDGWWRSEVEVALSATDDLSGVAHTNAAVDGGGMALYTGPFMVTGDSAMHTVDYLSVDNVGNVEATKTASIKIDATTPTTTLTVSGTMGDNGWLITPATVEVSGSDAMSGVRNSFYDIFFVVDGPLAFEIYAGPTTVTTEGEQAVRGYTEDIAGNEEVPMEELFKIDLTAPEITASDLDGAYQEGDSLSIDFSATDAVSGLASVTATWNGAPVSDGDSVTLIAGENLLVVTARDNAGHEATLSRAPLADVPASIHAHPRVLRKNSNGQAFTMHINLPEPYSPADIDCLTILVDGLVAPDCTHPGDGDEGGDGHGRLFMFDRAQIQAIAPVGEWTMVVTGTLTDGTPFRGTDTIRVTQK